MFIQNSNGDIKWSLHKVYFAFCVIVSNTREDTKTKQFLLEPRCHLYKLPIPRPVLSSPSRAVPQVSNSGAKQVMPYEADPEVSRTAESLAGLSLQPKPNPLPLGHKRLPSYLSRDFHPCPWPKENDSFGQLGDVSTVSEQEQLLLRDLLYVLIGIEGKYIRLQQSNVPPRYNLTLDPSTDRHLVAITNQILVIPPCYSSIVAYVESRVYGQVNQALVAAMQRHLFDYNMLVGEMEELMLQEELSLQKMFYMLKPYFTTFKLLAELSKHLYSNMFIGGRVLTVLHEKAKSIQAMDNKALELLLALTKSASEPYFDILKMWIYYGQVSDSKQEFFIVDTKHFCLGTSGGAAPGSAGDHGHGGGRGNSIFDSDDDDDEFDDDFGKFGVKYWDMRYRINSFKTPIFLEKYEPMIYKTGKYVSIINKAKALLVKKSSRVPFPPPLHLNDQHHRHAQYHSSRLEMMESNYSFDDLLSGLASMQITEDPTLPDVVLEQSTSFMSSNSYEMSDSFGPVIFTPKPEEISYSFDDESTYGQPIRAAYEAASSQLLHLLMHDSQLVATFNAVKHYLLLSKGDFIVHFINFAEKDLGCKRIDSVVQHRLHSMMGKAVGNSVAASDVSLLKNGALHVEFTGMSFLGQIDKIMMKPLDSMDLDCTSSNSLNFLHEEFDNDEDDDQEEANKTAKLYCYESLALKFDVPFPLSLIFTPKSTVCYQLMFRYVFLCRYAEMELEDTWKNNNVLNVQLKLCDQLAKNSAKDGLEPEDSVRNLVSAFKNVHKKAFVLRYKMIAFVRNFHYFYTLEVIEPLCGQFISQLNPKRGTSLDSVIECHEKFLERCFSSCSLTSLEITSIIIKIFMLCIELSHALKESNDSDTSMMESSCIFGQTHNPYSTMDSKSRDSLNDAPESKSTLDSQLHEKLRETVEKANREFDSLVAKLLEKIYSDNCGQYHMMYPFVARLDFNDFYGSKISA